MKRFILLIFVVLCATSMVGQNDTGNDLLPACQAAIDSSGRSYWTDVHEPFQAGFCLGLIEGVSAVSHHVCPPEGVTLQQEARIIVKFLKDNPDKLNRTESILTVMALSKAFPCPNVPQ